MVMISTENMDQQLPGSLKSSIAKEKNSEGISKIEELFAEGYRLYLSKELEGAAEKLGESNTLAVELYGQFAPECFKPHYYYGLTMLDIARNEAQVVKAPQDNEDTDDDEEADESADEVPEGEAPTTEADAEKVDENTPEQPARAVAGDGETTVAAENGKNGGGAVADETLRTEVGDTTGQEDDEDGEEPSAEVLAWESLEVARKICEKLEDSSEWLEKKAEVLVLLSDCMIIAEEYDTALNDLNSALEIQKKLFTPHDRRIAETLYHIGRCHRNSNDFENATISFQAAGRELQSLVDAINAQGDAATEEERKMAADLAAIIAEVEEAAQDALESGEARKKQLEESREIVANVFKQALSADVATNDISAMLTRKRPAPSSAGDNAAVVKPPTNSSGAAPTTATTTDAEANSDEKKNGDDATKTTDVHTTGIEMEEAAAPEGKKAKIGEEQ